MVVISRRLDLGKVGQLKGILVRLIMSTPDLVTCLTEAEVVTVVNDFVGGMVNLPSLNHRMKCPMVCAGLKEMGCEDLSEEGIREFLTVSVL